MAKVFQLGPEQIIFEGNIDEYNTIWQRLYTLTSKVDGIITEYYDECSNLEKLLASSKKVGLNCIDKIFTSFSDLYVAHGYFDFMT